MPFESLSHRHTVSIGDFPSQWLPFIHLYDADLIMFPLQYFHILSPDLKAGQSPGTDDRVFGYIERTRFVDSRARALTFPQNQICRRHYVESAEQKNKFLIPS